MYMYCKCQMNVKQMQFKRDAMQCACNAMQCNAMQCNAMQCNAMQCNAMQCNAMQCNGTNVMQCNAVCSMLYTETRVLIMLVLRPFGRL